MYVPVTALVAHYHLTLIEGSSKTEYPIDKILYIIFNPWNERDEVYMEDEELKQVSDKFLHFYTESHSHRSPARERSHIMSARI